MGRYLDTLRNSEKGGVATLTNLSNSSQHSSFGLLGSRLDEDKQPCNVISYRWLMHYVDRDSMIATFSPEVNHAGALAVHPDAVAAEPIAEEAKHLLPMSCDIDTDVMKPFDGELDDRRSCFQCTNLTMYGCHAARRGDIVASRSYTPERELPRRCKGYLPKMSDSDHRPGRERWPEIDEPSKVHEKNQDWELSPLFDTDDFTTA